MKKHTTRLKTLYHRAIEALEARQLLSGVVYVDASASGAVHDGTSWTSAFVDLQQGLAAANAGDEIHVADGTYKPGVNNESNATFQLKNGVALRGGYAGDGATNPDARDITTFTSILSGEISKYWPTFASYHVVTGSGCDATAILEGFTITKGAATGTAFPLFNPNSVGGGMYNDRGSPTVQRCVFTGNRASLSGSSIYNNLSSATFTSCTFTGNTGDCTGICSQDSTPVISDCDFVDNRGIGGTCILSYLSITTVWNCRFVRNAGLAGGAIMGQSATLNIANCSFQGNTASNRGGALTLEGSSSATITGCVFTGNTSQFGGAIEYWGNALKLENCTFTENSASISGDAVHCQGSSAGLQIRNCIFWSNGGSGGAGITAGNLANASVTTSDMQGGWTGAGNINAQPQFVRSPGAGFDGVWCTSDDDYGDLRLMLTSAAIDSGSNAAVSPGVITDILGNPRMIDVPGAHDTGAIVDMGAYERAAPFADGRFEINAPRPAVSVSFSGDVLPGSLSPSDLILTNLTTGELIDCGASSSVSYDEGTRVATWSFSNLLSDGNYRATLLAASVTDLLGQPAMTADLTFDFFVLAADANRDRKVDINDLAILASNWQGSGKLFSQGDFNYDGSVDAADLGILSCRWQQTLLPPAATAPTALSRAPKRTATRLVSVVP